MRARRACAQNAQNVHGSRVLFFISSAVSTVPRWHQLCPGQQAPACHRPQADHHLAQLRLVRLLEELPDELSSSVEAALAKIVHLLSIFLLHRVITTDSNLVFRPSNPVWCDHEKCYLVSRKELFHPIKGILAAGLQMEVIFKKTFGHPQIHRVDTYDQDTGMVVLKYIMRQCWTLLYQHYDSKKLFFV